MAETFAGNLPARVVVTLAVTRPCWADQRGQATGLRRASRTWLPTARRSAPSAAWSDVVRRAAGADDSSVVVEAGLKDDQVVAVDEVNEPVLFSDPT